MKLRNTVFIAIFATALISIISLLLFQQLKFTYAFNNYYDSEWVELLAVKDKDKYKDKDEVKTRLYNRLTKQQANSLFIATLFSLFTALISAYFLSRKLTQPIFDIASVLTSLRKGDLTSRSQYQHRNELGALAADLNVLATTLEQNRDARQRWIADISHELRTPITIMLGELECLEDGLTPFDKAAVASFKEEAFALYKLVADLHQLTQADQGKLFIACQPSNISEIVNTCLQKYQAIFQEREISVNNKLPAILMADVDQSRLQQVFINLFENCARYTDQLGNVRVSASQDNECIRLVIKNSAPKMSEESLSKLFDRLYRVDSSRNKASGGSGLGLAICAAIIEAHGGKISAVNSSSDGVVGNYLAISITLPISSNSTFQVRELIND